MGTRGAYGFRKNGEDKLTYNHFDSYPDWLGSNVVEFCQNTSLEEMRNIFDNLILVNETDKPTSEQIQACQKYADLDVSTRSVDDWYCLLRKSQGDLNAYKEGLNFMLNYNHFIKDSLFCEYAYIINLDTQELEFWVGYQNKPQKNNRYGCKKIDRYYPCKLQNTFPLAQLSDESINIMIKESMG